MNNICFKRVPVGDIIDLVIDYRGKTPRKLGGDWSDVGYRALSALNVKTREIVAEEDVRFVNADLYKKWMKNEIQKGDILITSEAPFGQVYQWRTDEKIVLSQRLFGLRIKPSYCSNYVFQYMTSSAFQGELRARATGSTVEGLRQPALLKCVIAIPDLQIAEKISDILSTYDDLIENNKKRIKILENLVKHWYQHKFSTEKIKEHSNLIKLGEVVQIIRGVSYSSEEIDCEDGNDLINLKNIQAFGGFRLDGTKKYNGKYKKEQIVKTGDLIMGVTDMTQDRRTVGSVALIPITQNTSVISADLIKIQSNLDSVFLYSMFRYGNISKYISQFANGANVLHLRPQAILNIKVFLPEEKKIMDFAQKVKPILDEINILNEKNANLAKQRDLLLPRLMSGKLEIKGTDDA